MPNRTPADTGSVHRWRWLGRLLPRDVRERVFDPAYADASYHWLTGAKGLPFGVHALGTWIGCVPIAIPRVLYRNGKLTRTGHVVVWGGAAALLVFVLVSNYAESYAAY